MLTSHKVSQDMPLGEFSKGLGQAPFATLDGTQNNSGTSPFASLISAMMAAGSEEGKSTLNEKLAEFSGLKNGLGANADFNADFEGFGYSLNSAMLGQEIDLASLSVEEFQGMLPPGLQRLVNLDETSFNALKEQLSVSTADLQNESGLVNMADVVKALAQNQSANDKSAAGINVASADISGYQLTEFPQASADLAESKHTAEQVHDLLGIPLPAAQVTAEIHRRNGLANGVAPEEISLSNIQALNSATELTPEAVGQVDSDIVGDLDTELPTEFDGSSDVNEFIDSRLVSDANESRAAVNANVADLNDPNAQNAASPEELYKAQTVAQTLAQTEAQTMAAQSGTQPLSQSADSRVQSATSGGQSGALNYQTSWGAQSSEATSSGQSGQNSQSFAGQGQQQQSAQANMMQQAAMANQQQMQTQEQKTQAFEQQLALKTADEALKLEGRGESLLSNPLTGEKRAQLPPGLQTIQVPVKSPQWGQALAQRVSFMANQQIQQAHITLNPEKLGPIQIKLHMDKDQGVHVSMVAQQGATRESMEMAIPRLREMLEQSGMNLASVDVSDENQAQQQDEEAVFANQGRAGNSNTEDALSEDEVSQNQVTVSENLVDYYA